MKKMIKRVGYLNSIIMTCIIALFNSCEDKSENYLGELSPYIAIEDLRAIYKGTDVTLSEEKINGAYKIYGVVISDHRHGNMPEGKIIMQQFKRNRLRGITLDAGSIATNYLPGDSIVVTVRDKVLKKSGFLTIEGINEQDIEKVSTVTSLTRVTTNANAINLNPSSFESTIVRILGGTTFPKPDGTTIMEGQKQLINGADTIGITTLVSAKFAKEIVPRNMNITGIMLGSTIGSKNHIYPRYFTDVVDVSDPEVPEYIGLNPVIITGFATDVLGADGNYEYVQLKANVDIDFKVVPFSLVTSTNGGSAAPNPGAAPGAGWATGGGRTYKFNLNEGSVKKGEYFYVGGHQRSINGPNSTKINTANWIRYIQYSTTAGDGFGNPSSGLLPNSGNAGGIAIFIGTNVTEQSTPVDVVFYGGEGLTTIIDETNEKGYRIGNTDHYSIANSNGDSQPFFSMGTNMFRFPHQTKEQENTGIFYKLGGVFDITTRKWVTPRTSTLYLMSKESKLPEIESGAGTTLQNE